MAIMKIIAIRDRLDKRVNYVTDGQKTALDAGVSYIANPEKTEQTFFTAAIQCRSPETAYHEMMSTKRRWGKTGGVLGYHFIQSFAPGEVTPEQAHAIGLEFVSRMFGDRYEVVLGTHLDKAHLHNHMIVNSVSLADGKKYHSSPGSYFFQVRPTSDELCRENGLSVITPQGTGKHYAEWKAERTGKPTIRAMIREDIDGVIAQAYTFDTFLMLLQRKGYSVKAGPNRKFTTAQPPGAKRAIRLDSLGEGYTETAIKERLARQRTEGRLLQYHLPQKRYRLRGHIAILPKKKIKGFRALYLRYLYLLRRSRRTKRRPLPFSIRQEVVRLERYQQQFHYLLEQNITTSTELEQRIAVLELEIQALTEERRPLYQKRRLTSDEAQKMEYSLEIDCKTASLREKRRELALCRRIQADIPQVSEQVRQAQEKERLMRKEEPQHEYQR